MYKCALPKGYAYHQCLKQHSASHGFIGFIDIDEFIVINDAKAGEGGRREAHEEGERAEY